MLESGDSGRQLMSGMEYLRSLDIKFTQRRDLVAG